MRKCPPLIEEEPEPSEIKVDIENPCLKAMVEAIINNGLEFAAEKTLEGIFDSNSKINLLFTSGSFSAPYENADAGTLITKIGFERDGKTLKNMDIRIKLNINTMPSSSKQYITATIIHETLHAYFDYINKKSDPNGQHTTMATSTYRTWFKKAMKDIYPTMTDTHIEALAWGGLEETQAYTDYKNDHPNDELQTSQINDDYYNGDLGVKCG